MMSSHSQFLFFFFFNDTATTEIYTLSLHDALPISQVSSHRAMTTTSSTAAKASGCVSASQIAPTEAPSSTDRKSTRLNSSHLVISYAVFCLKKKKNITILQASYILLHSILPVCRTS